MDQSADLVPGKMPLSRSTDSPSLLSVALFHFPIIHHHLTLYLQINNNICFRTLSSATVPTLMSSSAFKWRVISVFLSVSLRRAERLVDVAISVVRTVSCQTAVKLFRRRSSYD